MTRKPLCNLYIASGGDGGGIFHCVLHSDGFLALLKKTDLPHPMHLAASSNRLYVLLRHPFPGKEESGLTELPIREDGSLGRPGPILSTKGTVACHLCVWDGAVYAANYLSGSVIRMPDLLRMHTGCGPDKKRQEGPHPHFVSPSPDGDHLLATDLGTDSIITYDKWLHPRFTAQVPKGHGARHLAFSADGSLVYCVNEMASTVTVFSYQKGELYPLQTYSTLPYGFSGDRSAAAIRRIDGNLYVSNRGHDSIAVFKIAGNGLEKCQWVGCGGSWPRDFDVFGEWLICANERSDNITVFRRHYNDLIKQPGELQIQAPSCILIQGRIES